MLKNLDPLLGPDLLHVLASMGHGDELAVVDANFPAASGARRLVRVDGASATAVVRAVLSVMPLDTFVDAPLASMAVVGDAAAVPDAVREFDSIAFKAHGAEAKRDALERNAFYARAHAAYAIVQTGETRLYANLLLRKGVVAPGGAA